MSVSAQPHVGEWALRRKRAGPARPLARPGTLQHEAVSGQHEQAVSVGPMVHSDSVVAQAPPVLPLHW